ncbi:MAG: toxin-antitoxin system HicB family antitoxin [Phycisphaerales bacterium]|nr:toxin-antitoxin system HicB family antitoxin [Phycisphaerales bacterium]
MADRKHFLLRLDPKLHRELEAMAQQEMRSVNAQIEWILREAVQRWRGGRKDEKERGG